MTPLNMRAIWVAVCFIFCASLSWAQDNVPDYAVWQSTATRAENAIETARASDVAFDNLRAEIAGWRQQFQTQLNANNSRLQTLQDQIAALGPAPEEGQSEVEEIASRRTELNAQLERLSTPRRTAEEAFSRANGIIAEIDEILRTRQTDALLNMGPWPVNPAHWPGAFRELQDSVSAVESGARQAWSTPSSRARAQDNLPLILILLVFGIVLLARSRYWTELLATRIQHGDSRSGARVASFLVSLGQILFPMLGLLALVRALRVSDLFGARGDVLFDCLEIVGLVLFSGRWLAARLFPVDATIQAPLALRDGRRAEARFYVVALAVVYAVHQVLARFSDFDRYSPVSDAVLQFPLILLGALILICLGWLARGSNGGNDTGDEANQDIVPKDRIVGSVARVVVIVGLVSPILAAVGFGAAARFLVFPMILTLALLGAVVLLQSFVRDVYASLRPGDGARDSLVPTLLSFLVVLLSLVPLPLIWGARVTDLTEIWTTLQNGLSFGGISISPGSFFTLIVVFTVGYLITRAVQNALKTSVLPKTKIDPGGQVAIVSGLGYVGIFLAALMAITSAGIDLSSLAIVAGALSVGIGFGLQTIVSNFVSGIILLIERPISEGDWIEVGGQMGYVRSISVRSTRIETFDRTDVIVPNADLISGTVTNFTRGNTVGRVIVPVGVAYGSDTRRVEQILTEIGGAHPMALANPAPKAVFMGFGADSMDFEIRIILRDVNWMLSVKSEINHQIAERFAAEGIEIPFAQRDVWLRNPEALQPQNARPEVGIVSSEAPETDTAYLDDGDVSGVSDTQGDAK